MSDQPVVESPVADTLDRSPAGLRAARAAAPKARIRDLANSLGLAEGHFVAADVDGTSVVRIEAHPDKLIPEVAKLGSVLALTRNESAVHERDGAYEKYVGGPHASMVLGPDIDLRIFPSHWVYGFALNQNGKRSVQVFDAAGDAVHKVHLREHSNVAAFDALVEALRLPEQSDSIETGPRAPTEAPKSNPEKLDILQKEWAELTDTHQFMRLTSKLRMNRLGAYRIVGAPFVRRLANDAVSKVLRGAAEGKIEIMIFVGNRGCIQIHAGPVETIKDMGPWDNVLDPGFNLHLRADHIAETWAVTKPTKHGAAISVEAFDAEGGLILQLFGKRLPGVEAGTASGPLTGTEGWDALVAALPSAE